MTYPTWEEIFNKPSMSTCTVPCPEAWQGDSVLMQVIDQECARLLVEALFAEAKARRGARG